MFYYKDEYPEQVAEAAKNLILARDKYIEAFFNWRDASPIGMDDIYAEISIIETIMMHIEEMNTSSTT